MTVGVEAIRVVRTVPDLRAVVAGWRREGARVGLVPTMGALHDGHASLVTAALRACDRVVATLFVNPKQFDDARDLAAYPRDEDADARRLAGAGAHLLYAPDAGAMYPPGFATTVSVAGVSEGLCGAHRPGHFDGVSTVVTKLLLQAGADAAFFGEKDYQQLQVIRRLVRDLDIPVAVHACPTVREPDGLALSSRNRRLSAAARAVAPRLAEAMAAAARRLRAGEAAAPVLDDASTAIVAGGFERVEYLELRDADLVPLDRADRPARLLAAAWLDGVRLIDNLAV